MTDEEIKPCPFCGKLDTPVMAKVAIARLRRKVQQRDQRIAGMQRRIEDLEHSLSMHAMKVQSLPADVTKAVQRALCNVRMVPVHGGLSSMDRILDVRVTKDSGDGGDA